jgi:hypothetical protein
MGAMYEESKPKQIEFSEVMQSCQLAPVRSNQQYLPFFRRALVDHEHRIILSRFMSTRCRKRR